MSRLLVVEDDPDIALALRLLFWLAMAGWKPWAAMSWAELERDCEGRGEKSKSLEARESTEERASEVPDRPRWWVASELLVEVLVSPRSRPEMEAALSSSGRLSLSCELARTRVPSCRATPRSP